MYLFDLRSISVFNESLLVQMAVGQEQFFLQIPVSSLAMNPTAPTNVEKVILTKKIYEELYKSINDLMPNKTKIEEVLNDGIIKAQIKQTKVDTEPYKKSKYEELKEDAFKYLYGSTGQQAKEAYEELKNKHVEIDPIEESAKKLLSQNAYSAEAAKKFHEALQKEMKKLSVELDPTTGKPLDPNLSPEKLGAHQAKKKIMGGPPGHNSAVTLANTLPRHIPGLDSEDIKCPAAGYDDEIECEEDDPTCKPVYNLIMHLNDEHRWSRKQIADWLDTLDLDLSINTQGGSNETD